MNNPNVSVGLTCPRVPSGHGPEASPLSGLMAGSVTAPPPWSHEEPPANTVPFQPDLYLTVPSHVTGVVAFCSETDLDVTNVPSSRTVHVRSPQLR